GAAEAAELPAHRLRLRTRRGDDGEDHAASVAGTGLACRRRGCRLTGPADPGPRPARPHNERSRPTVLPMIPIRFLASSAWLLVSTVAAAQPLYRCGNTYSQTPCAAAASAVRIAAGAVPDAAEGLQGKELCSATVPRLLQLGDPAAVRVESVVKGDAEVIQYAGQPVATRKYLLSINVANAYGAWTGARSFTCHL